MALAMTNRVHTAGEVAETAVERDEYTQNSVATASGLTAEPSIRVETWPEELEFGDARDEADSVKTLTEWLYNNEGVVRDLGGLGSRAYVAGLQRWETHEYGPVLWKEDKGMCGASAVVHALDAVRGRKIALGYRRKLQELRPVIAGLRGLAEVLRQMKAHVPPQIYARVELQKIGKAEKQAFERAPYTWLCEQRRCFVVQFEVPGKLNHAVCVDGRRKLVWDNEQGYPVELNPDSLRLCTSMKGGNVTVRAMEMVKQREKKKGEKEPAVIQID